MLGIVSNCSSAPFLLGPVVMLCFPTHLAPSKQSPAAFSCAQAEVCKGWGYKNQLLSRSAHSCVCPMSVSVMLKCHFAISFSLGRERVFLGGQDAWWPHLTSPFRLVCCKKRCGEFYSRTGWDGGEWRRPAEVTQSQSQVPHQYLL